MVNIRFSRVVNISRQVPSQAKKLDTSGGYITLLLVLIVGAIGVATSLSLILLGLDSSRTSHALEESGEAKAYVNACVEEALERIRSSAAFAASGTLTFGRGSCTYTVTSLGGDNRNVDASGTAGRAVRKVNVTLDQIAPRIRLSSWREVADF